MKEQTRKRGLFRLVNRTAETEDELFQVLEELSTSLDRYVADAEELASRLLAEAGIDPDTLFDVVESSSEKYIRWARINRLSLPPEVDQALDILIHCRAIKSSLSDCVRRDGLYDGIRLAQAVSNLNANLAWRKIVDARKQSNKNLRQLPSVSDEQILDAVGLHSTKVSAANYLGITTRQLRNRVKKIDQK